jgi:transposase
MADCIGTDVSKHALEWCVGSEGRIQHTRNEPRPIAQTVRRIAALDPERIIVESTGGYERKLVRKLAEAGLPVAVALLGGGLLDREHGEAFLEPLHLLQCWILKPEVESSCAPVTA